MSWENTIKKVEMEEGSDWTPSPDRPEMMTQPQRPPDKGGIELLFEFTHRAGDDWYEETAIAQEFIDAVINHPTLKQMGVKITRQASKERK
jgi:hypothetical protein